MSLSKADDEYWVPNEKHICLIATKTLNQTQQNAIEVEILTQDFNTNDQELSQLVGMKDAINLNQLKKVDRLAKQGVDDLMAMDDLNDFNSLHNVRVRYFKRQIYSQVGTPILIAVNPYEDLQNLYSADTIKQYKTQMKLLQGVNKDQLQQKLREIEPHLFKVAQLAFDQLFEEKETKRKARNSFGVSREQLKICSIIISGESGAGKTESTKTILRYLAGADNKQLPQQQNQIIKTNSIQQQVFASNPLLEAFGNAKTARNDNSSRFGKFIHIYFNQSNKNIHSAQIDNYLLEKTRVVSNGPMERNYHIFYQLLASKNQQRKNSLKITKAKDYNYLKNSDLQYAPYDESKDFDETLQCLNQMNFSEQEIEGILQIVAGILHLGNLNISGDESKSSLDENTAQFPCQLLGFKVEQLNSVICNRKMLVGKQEIVKNNGQKAAHQLKDGLAKQIYNKLFDWLIWRVNQVLQRHHGQSVENEFQPRLSIRDSFPAKFMIGVLDIFGFEIFEDTQTKLHSNSFEQLCINFANEALQEHFNRHMLETEQIEYKDEQIQWNSIDFPNNKDIIQVIGNQSKGIFRILNEEGFTNGNDEGFLKKLSSLDSPSLVLKETFDKKVADSRVDKKHKVSAFKWFCIKHFAGGVVYNVDGFVEKNKDQTNPEFLNMLKSSSNQVIQQISEDYSNQNDKIESQTNRASQNVSTFFKSQLESLMTLLNQSTPYYIRCIKPNNVKKPQEFDAREIIRQMRCAGLLEAIKIRKAGYEIRMNYQTFAQKYRIIAKSKINNNDYAEQCKQETLSIMQFWSSSQEYKGKFQNQILWQSGRTKIFMKEAIRNFLDQRVNEFKMQYILILQRAFKKIIFKIKIKRVIIRRINIRKVNKSIFKLRSNLLSDALKNIKQSQKQKQQIDNISQIDISESRNSLFMNDQSMISSQIFQSSKQFEDSKSKNVLPVKQFSMTENEIKNNLNESQISFISRSGFIQAGNSKQTSGYGKMKEYISELETKLQQERTKRIEAEQQVQTLEELLENQPQKERESVFMPRDSFAVVGQLNDLLSYEKSIQQQTELQLELEKLRTESSVQLKNNEKQIQSLNSQVAALTSQIDALNQDNNQLQERLNDLEAENDQILSDYLEDKKKIEQQVQEWENKLKQERIQWAQKEEQIQKQKKSSVDEQKLAQKLQEQQVELQKAKKSCIDLECENKKLLSLNQHLQGLVDQLQEQELATQNLKDQLSQSQQEKSKILSEMDQLKQNQKELQQQINDLKSQNTQKQGGHNSETLHLQKQNQELTNALKKRERYSGVQKKLIEVMNNMIKLKLVQINHLHQKFNVTSENKNEIYQSIKQIIEKEDSLMKKFEEYLQELTNSKIE